MIFDRFVVAIVSLLGFGQNRIYAPYMTVYLVISLPRIPCMHHIHVVMANPTYCSLTNSIAFSTHIAHPVTDIWPTQSYLRVHRGSAAGQP